MMGWDGVLYYVFCLILGLEMFGHAAFDGYGVAVLP